MECRVNRGVAVDLARVVGEFPHDIEWDLDVLKVGIIETDRLHQREEGDAEIVLCLDKRRLGVGQLDLRLEHVEPWDGSGVVAALLVGDLCLVGGHLLLVGDHKGPVENNLVELLDNLGDCRVDCLAELEIGDLFGEFCGRREGRGLPSVVKKLVSLKGDIPALVVRGEGRGVGACRADLGSLAAGKGGFDPRVGGLLDAELREQAGPDGDVVA